MRSSAYIYSTALCCDNTTTVRMRRSAVDVAQPIKTPKSLKRKEDWEKMEVPMTTESADIVALGVVSLDS